MSAKLKSHRLCKAAPSSGGGRVSLIARRLPFGGIQECAESFRRESCFRPPDAGSTLSSWTDVKVVSTFPGCCSVGVIGRCLRKTGYHFSCAPSRGRTAGRKTASHFCWLLRRRFYRARRGKPDPTFPARPLKALSGGRGKATIRRACFQEPKPVNQISWDLGISRNKGSQGDPFRCDGIYLIMQYAAQIQYWPRKPQLVEV